MDPKDSPAQPGSSSQEAVVVDDQSSRRYTQPQNGIASVTPPAYLSRLPTYYPHDPGTVDTVYKIVCSDRRDYLLNGKVYFRYNLPPELDSTGWFCIVAFYCHDVHAEFECVYHPSIKLFDDFRLVQGSLDGGSGGIRSVELSMWNFADRGPDLNLKHTVMDDNGNRIMLALMTLREGSRVTLYGKMVQEGEDENWVGLSGSEGARLGLRFR